MTKTPILMTILGALALCTTAQAAPGHGNKHFEKLDTNSDGKISRDEFARMQTERFQKADLNKDGKVTKEEMKDSFHAKMKDHFQKRLARLDANADGKISRAEGSKIPAEKFERLDANGDGYLAGEELTKRPKHRAKGKGDKPHGPRHDRGAKMWQSLDADGDGAITLAEMKASAPFFTRFDKNGDGFVTRDELAKLERPHPKENKSRPTE